MVPSADGSSTSRRRPSRRSPRSARGSWTSASPGEDHGAGLGRSAIRDLAARHDIRPRRSLGQHFLVDPNLARAIVADAGVRPGDRILEVGAGLGSLTVALAEAADARGAIVAVEFDRSLVPALREVVDPYPNVTVLRRDALRTRWEHLLEGGPWKMVSNLPYNVAVPLVVELLERVPQIERYLVMVQREVGERLVAGPGEDAYGAVSVRVAYRAGGRAVRRVPPSVFWPEPKVESVLVELVPRKPPVQTPPEDLFRLVEAGFAERRKTMVNALVRMGVPRDAAADALRDCGIDTRARAETLSLEDFARLSDAISEAP